MKNKNPWVRMLTFCGELSLCILLACDGLLPKNNGLYDGLYNAQAYGFQSEPANSIDVYIVGNSNAGAAWSPMTAWYEDGITSYVSSTPWQNMAQAYHLFRMAVKAQHPKIVVLETDELFTHKKDLDTSIFEELFPLLKYHDRWKQFRLSNLFQKTEYTCIYAAKGQTVRTTSKPYTGRDYMAAADGTETVSSGYLYFLNQFVSDCRKAGITLVLADVPSASSWSMKRHNTIQAYADAHGLAFYDMNISNADYAVDLLHDFRDGGDHLNADGAETMTSYLARALQLSYSLPDHRDDSAYTAEWNDCYEKYLKEREAGQGY